MEKKLNTYKLLIIILSVVLVGMIGYWSYATYFKNTLNQSGYTANGVIKKSTSEICHSPGTTYYDKTQEFTSYNTIEECLDSGGRLPKK